MIGNWFSKVKRFYASFLKIEVENILVWILDAKKEGLCLQTNQEAGPFRCYEKNQLNKELFPNPTYDLLF